MTFSEGILICVESFDARGLDKKNQTGYSDQSTPVLR